MAVIKAAVRYPKSRKATEDIPSKDKDLQQKNELKSILFIKSIIFVFDDNMAKISPLFISKAAQTSTNALIVAISSLFLKPDDTRSSTDIKTKAILSGNAGKATAPVSIFNSRTTENSVLIKYAMNPGNKKITEDIIAPK